MSITGTPIRHVATVLMLLILPLCASAQELTPGAYWPLPGGINIFTAVNSFNWGDVAFDPSLPVQEARAKIDTVAIAFTRTLSVAGRSANVGVQVPIVTGHLEGLYLGTPTSKTPFLAAPVTRPDSTAGHPLTARRDGWNILALPKLLDSYRVRPTWAGSCAWATGPWPRW